MTIAEAIEKRGQARGRTEGRAEGQLALARKLIAAKFGGLPSSLDERLGKLSLEELEEVGLRILTATSLDELLPG